MMKDENYWEIQDNKGVIHSGSEDEMMLAWDVMVNVGDLEAYIEDKADTDVDRETLEAIYNDWICEWEGDLKLVEVHNVYR